MKSWTLFGVCALVGAVTMMRRKPDDARTLAEREVDRCEGLLRGLGARCADFR